MKHFKENVEIVFLNFFQSIDCCTVHTALAFDTGRPQFESSHWQLIVLLKRRKMKKNRTRITHLMNIWISVSLRRLQRHQHRHQPQEREVGELQVRDSGEEAKPERVSRWVQLLWSAVPQRRRRKGQVMRGSFYYSMKACIGPCGKLLRL